MQENCKLRWVASGAMLADCLTKAMDASRLRECLKTGRYALFDEQMVLKQRSDKRRQLQWVKQQGDRQQPSPNEACFQSFHGQSDFWRMDKQRGFLERVHRQPRWVRFTPVGVGECPVAIGDLGVHRITFCKPLSSQRTKAIEDTWVGTAANASEGQAWTGVTRFFLSQKPEASVKALTSQTS